MNDKRQRLEAILNGLKRPAKAITSLALVAKIKKIVKELHILKVITWRTSTPKHLKSRLLFNQTRDAFVWTSTSDVDEQFLECESIYEYLRSGIAF